MVDKHVYLELTITDTADRSTFDWIQYFVSSPSGLRAHTRHLFYSRSFWSWWKCWRNSNRKCLVLTPFDLGPGVQGLSKAHLIYDWQSTMEQVWTTRFQEKKKLSSENRGLPLGYTDKITVAVALPIWAYAKDRSTRNKEKFDNQVIFHYPRSLSWGRLHSMCSKSETGRRFTLQDPAHNSLLWRQLPR